MTKDALKIQTFNLSQDRVAWQSASVPQEDMCQALGVPNFEKNQSDGGPGIHKIMDLLNESQRREEDRDLFMRAQVIFLFLAAIDGTQKTLVFVWGPPGFWMTPLYDVLSAQPVVDRGDFQYPKIKVAMAVGSRKFNFLGHEK